MIIMNNLHTINEEDIIQLAYTREEAEEFIINPLFKENLPSRVLWMTNIQLSDLTMFEDQYGRNWSSRYIVNKYIIPCIILKVDRNKYVLKSVSDSCYYQLANNMLKKYSNSNDWFMLMPPEYSKTYDKCLGSHCYEINDKEAVISHSFNDIYDYFNKKVIELEKEEFEELTSAIL